MSVRVKEAITLWSLVLFFIVLTVCWAASLSMLEKAEATNGYWRCTEDQTGEKLDLPHSAAANAVALHCVKHKIERRT